MRNVLKNNATRHISLTQTLLKVNVLLYYQKMLSFSIDFLKNLLKNGGIFIMERRNKKVKERGNRGTEQYTLVMLLIVMLLNMLSLLEKEKH